MKTEAHTENRLLILRICFVKVCWQDVHHNDVVILHISDETVADFADFFEADFFVAGNSPLIKVIDS